MNFTLREFFKRKIDAICMWIAWRIPKRIAMWTYVRIGAHATTGKYGNTIVPEITMMEALKRWET